MTNRKILFIAFIFVPLLSFRCSDSPVHKLSGQGVITEWVILGPFPNPAVDTEMPDGSYQLGYYTDYLESLGSEPAATLSIDTKIRFTDEQKITHELACKKHITEKHGIVNFNKIYHYCPDVEIFKGI